MSVPRIVVTALSVALAVARLQHAGGSALQPGENGTSATPLTTIASGSQSAQQSPEMVEIPPEKIPEHWIWRTSFLLLAWAKQENERLKEEDQLKPLSRSPNARQIVKVELTDDEFKIVYAEAAAQEGRDQECEVGLRRLIEKLKAEGRSPAAISEALHEAQVTCRWKVLEARDRVLAKLSPEGAASLQMWVYNRRHSAKVTCPKNELEHFMLPQ